MQEYLGPNSGGTGTLATLGVPVRPQHRQAGQLPGAVLGRRARSGRQRVRDVHPRDQRDPGVVRQRPALTNRRPPPGTAPTSSSSASRRPTACCPGWRPRCATTRSTRSTDDSALQLRGGLAARSSCTPTGSRPIRSCIQYSHWFNGSNYAGAHRRAADVRPRHGPRRRHALDLRQHVVVDDAATPAAVRGRCCGRDRRASAARSAWRSPTPAPTWWPRRGARPRSTPPPTEIERRGRRTLRAHGRRDRSRVAGAAARRGAGGVRQGRHPGQLRRQDQAPADARLHRGRLERDPRHQPDRDAARLPDVRAGRCSRAATGG